eukprot:gene7232-340_t
MSVATVAPFQRKRQCEEDSWEASGINGNWDLKAGGAAKRARHVGSSLGAARRWPLDLSSQLATLASLYPGMDNETVASVLSECGGNLDFAIQRLGELKLAGPDGAASESPSQANTGPSGEQWVEFLVTEMVAAKDMSDARTKAANLLQQFEECVKNRTKAEVGSIGEQWVEFLVTEMVAAKDMGYARAVAANLLQQFEECVKNRTKAEFEECVESRAKAESSSVGSGGS